VSGGGGVSKKRGRKPKGGKIIPNTSISTVGDMPPIENIILHLRCVRNDIVVTPETATIPSTSASSASSAATVASSDAVSPDDVVAACVPERSFSTPTSTSFSTSAVELELERERDDGGDRALCERDNEVRQGESNITSIITDALAPSDAPVSMSRVHKKLNELHYNFRNNMTYGQKSDCFWCTCAFSTPSVCIPLNICVNGTYRVYGNFCMPECALAYLMNEHIDSSTKYERSALLHSLYRDVYEYSNDAIKPNPPPHYTLNKYCGNLTIEEYRSLYKSHRYVMVLNKPITKVYPEIHEDNADFVMKTKTIPTHTEKGDTYLKSGASHTLSNFVIVNQPTG
jgi:hypothetical protein